MKKISTLIIVLFITVISQAQQIPKGTVILGGTLGFSRSIQEGSATERRNTNFNLSPGFGKFYRANRAAGINLNYSRASSNDNSTDGNFYGIGFFLRQYLPIGKSFYIFGEENIYAQTGKLNQMFSGSTKVEIKSKSISLNLYPGMAYAVSRKFQFEVALTNLLSIGYYSEKRLDNNNGSIAKTGSKNFALNAGSGTNILGNLMVGAKWFFAKR